MKVTATSYPSPMPDVPERCAGCGTPLLGCGLDAPAGWFCSIDCPGAYVDDITRPVPFSQTGLDRPT